MEPVRVSNGKHCPCIESNWLNGIDYGLTWNVHLMHLLKFEVMLMSFVDRSGENLDRPDIRASGKEYY
jgi:hypothetical protein